MDSELDFNGNEQTVTESDGAEGTDAAAAEESTDAIGGENSTDSYISGADVDEDDTAADAPTDDEGTDEPIDYAALARRDLAELAELFPEVRGKASITELNNPLRYAALRDLGLSPKEAYLATRDRRTAEDNRQHLVSRVPSGAGSSGALSGKDLDMARELFGTLSDREIQRLYKKVNG